MSVTFIAHNQSAKDRALAIPELLDNVFAYLGRHDAAHAAQLFGLLAPPQSRHNHTHTYNVEVTERRVDRFLPIARRVRELHSMSSKAECHKDNHSFLCNNEAFFEDLATMVAARGHVLFPRLVYLRWWDLYSSMYTWPLFGSSVLTEVNIIVPHCCLYTDSLTALSVLAPSVKSICLTAYPPKEYDGTVLFSALDVELLDDGWPDVFERLKNLTTLAAPVNFLTSAALAAAATSPNLAILRFHTTSDPKSSIRKRQSITDFPTPSFAPGSFPSLSMLELAAPLVAYNNILRDANFPTHQLRQIGVRAVQAETESEIRSVLSTLSERAGPALSTLRILLASRYRWDEPQTDMDEPDEAEARSWRYGKAPGRREQLHAATFSPLHGASNLAILDVAHRFSVRINDDELVELVQALPALVVLSLNPVPVVVGGTPLTLRVLGRLARIRPFMEVIRFYLDATLEDEEPLPDRVDRFRGSLRSLWLDASPITMNQDKLADVAYYLSMVLPPNRTLSNTPLPDGLDGSPLYFWDHVPPVSSDRVHAWSCVTEMIRQIRESEDEDDTAVPVSEEVSLSA
ncbi:unnamed protein product [Peniophora sp. CBMAI 1063]|nr:unnamed protein product [Peniophora sp. CBMAI 1063]